MPAGAQVDAVLSQVDKDIDKSLERLFAHLRIKSISADPAHAEDCKAMAAQFAKEIASLGFSAEVKPTGGHPAVVATSSEGSGPRVLFYGHYDVQPVDPLDLWDKPPFEPAIKTIDDGRKVITARGAADDKGQVMTFLEACRAWRTVTGKLPLPITVLLEGEEEVGSKHLPAFLAANKKDLSAEVALVCDTNMWDRTTPAITTSLRGLVYDEITVHAANRDLHSGLYGGAARNPVRVLARIIADLHDDNGRITVPGFYDGVDELPDEVRKQWAELDFAPVLNGVGLSIPAGEKDRMMIEQIYSRPTCDVNGIVGGYTGPGAKTVIASQASAKVSFRLVGRQDPDKIRDAWRAFAKARVPADCSVEFEGHSGAPATSLDWGMKQLAAARQALTEEWGKPALLIGGGGSIPVIGDFKKTLGLDTLLVGFGLDDNRIHSPNEKYDLTSFHKGTRSWVRILAALADAK